LKNPLGIENVEGQYGVSSNDLPINGNNLLKLQKGGNKKNVQINVPEEYTFTRK